MPKINKKQNWKRTNRVKIYLMILLALAAIAIPFFLSDSSITGAVISVLPSLNEPLQENCYQETVCTNQTATTCKNETIQKCTPNCIPKITEVCNDNCTPQCTQEEVNGVMREVCTAQCIPVCANETISECSGETCQGIVEERCNQEIVQECDTQTICADNSTGNNNKDSNGDGNTNSTFTNSTI
ncbi:MAG: hypothetical protein AABX05_01015, partial [Nanoarchaeota archaeon]